MEHLFWDSCVFNALLYDENGTYDVDSIQQYLDEANDGKFRIYTSSLFLAEVAASKIKLSGYGGPIDFLNHFQNDIVVIDASLEVMELAGRLKDIPYRKQDSKNRRLTTGDAAMLATALYLQDVYGVTLQAFHTFDDGGKKREVSLLSYEHWCEGLTGNRLALAKRVIAMPRARPVHPSPKIMSLPRGKKP